MTDDLDDLLTGEERDAPKTTPQFDSVRCPYCRGSGRNWERHTPCWKCKGEGIVARARKKRGTR